MKELRKSDTHDIIYLDETAINAHHTCTKEWVSSDGSAGRKIPTGKGDRLVLLHAMNNKGFVPGCQLLFRGHSTDGRDYHREMNATVFEDWVKSSLLPALQKPSCIVMDNASYHSREEPSTKAPTTKSKKQDMIDWLQKNEISFPENCLKPQLYNIIKANKPPKQYVSDNLITAGGIHQILRLPPYHCDLNPIEMIWGITKNKVATNNTKFNLEETKKLTQEALGAIDGKVFASTCNHVIGVEDNYWQRDGLWIAPKVKDVEVVFDSDSDSDTDTASEFEDEEVLW